MKFIYAMTARKYPTFTLYLLAVCTEYCFAYPRFQSEIPNGGSVPNPCKSNYVWKGVGHLNPNGGGDRNPFGRAFYAANKTWTRELCQADSDGDGLTNGQELGDPNCVWTLGSTPNRTTGLSHPGVCQPVESPACATKTGQLEWVNCNYTDFKCDAVNNTDTRNITVRFPVTPVPAEETTYMCMTFDLPSDEEYHLIAIEPIIANENLMHHIILFGCQNETYIVNQPYQCGMSPGRNCSDFLGLWSVGLSGVCFHEKAGFRIGRIGFKKAALQFHWNNPELRSDYVDNSGVILYYTDKLRENDAGILLLGQTRLRIPPGQERVVTTSSCPGNCTAALMRGPIYITATFNHMHYLGIEQHTSIIPIDGKEKALADDNVYKYDSPVVYSFADPIKVHPLDTFTSTCVYRSTSRSEYTYFGEATKDEMCYAFIWYYPKENLTIGSCTSYANISKCELRNGVIEGCDFRKTFNFGNPSLLQTLFYVTSACSTDGKCKPECIPVAKEVKNHPCFKGNVGLYIRELATTYLDGNFKAMLTSFFMALDSCDAQIEGGQQEEGKDEGDKESMCHDGQTCSNGISMQAMFSVVCLCLVSWFMW